MKKYLIIFSIICLWIFAMWAPSHVRADSFMFGGGGGAGGISSYSDVVTHWSGTCTTGYVLGSDGACVANGGGSGTLTGLKGDVTTTGTGTATATVRSGSTTTTGIVQLVDSVTSTSVSTAATPSSVKAANDNANSKQAALNGAYAASFNTRTGAVIPQSGDYTESNIPNLVSDLASKMAASNPSLGTGYLSGTKIAGANGVSQYTLVRLQTDATVTTMSLSGSGLLGIAATTVAASLPVEIATRGSISCYADNNTTINNIVTVGSVTAGYCRDTGTASTSLIGNTTQIVGRFLTAVSAGQLAVIQLYGPGYYGNLVTASDIVSGMGYTPVSYTGSETLTNKILSNDTLGTGYLSTTKVAGSSGTTANTIVKIDTDASVITAGLSDVSILGIAVSSQATGSNTEVATRGVASCLADNATTIGHIVTVGTTTAGYCRDSGQINTTSIDIGAQVIGKFISSVSAGNVASVQLYGPGHFGANVNSHTPVTASFMGGGYPLVSGKTVYKIIDFIGTISGYTILCDQNAGSTGVKIDVWKKAYAQDTLPTIANTITSSATPSVLSGHSTIDSSILSGWTTTVGIGDVLSFSTITTSTVTWCSIRLKFTP